MNQQFQSPSILIAISALIVWWCAVPSMTIGAAEPAEYLGNQSRHRILPGDAPPGYIGQARLNGRGPVNGYFQPVAISGPQGTQFAFAQGGAFVAGDELCQAGLMIGSVYRFRVTNMPGLAGAELYPTIEVIDRTYPPPGLATRFPIRVDLDYEDFRAAINGQMVTRVIYLEDPQTATPLVQDKDTTRPIDILENQDPLEIADRHGRPVAIVRIGSMVPPREPALWGQFFFGFPHWAPIYRQPGLTVDQSGISIDNAASVSPSSAGPSSAGPSSAGPSSAGLNPGSLSQP